MFFDDSVPARRVSSTESGEQQPSLATEEGAPGQATAGIPALQDWIAAAEAATWTPIARTSIAVFIVVLGILLALRLGWLPS
jgi:hypothetical protein